MLYVLLGLHESPPNTIRQDESVRRLNTLSWKHTITKSFHVQRLAPFTRAMRILYSSLRLQKYQADLHFKTARRGHIERIVPL